MYEDLIGPMLIAAVLGLLVYASAHSIKKDEYRPNACGTSTCRGLNGNIILLSPNKTYTVYEDIK